MSKALDLTDIKFGRLSAMWPAGRYGKRIIWALACECGKTVYSRSDALLEGRTVSCGCKKVERAMTGAPRVTHGWMRCGKRKLEAALYHGARSRAKSRGMECTITPSDIVVPKVCPVLGIPISRGPKIYDGSPTLDRVDSSLGYTPKNTRVISFRANRIKCDATVAELEKILAYMKSEQVGPRAQRLAIQLEEGVWQ